jgi:hypothetical protein
MSDQDICPICCEKLDENIEELLCGHRYHKQCIFTSYKIETQTSKSGVHRKCPYCRQNGGYLKLEPNTIPIKYIHREYYEFKKHVENKDIEKLKLYMNGKKCFAILKSGINKDKQCNSKQNGETMYCKKHS